MGRRNKNNWYSDNYWQTFNYNQIVYSSLRNQIINIACSRFRWLNLPKSCDERYLERTLLFNGVATIAHPKEGKLQDKFFSTMITSNEYPNIYDNYTKWDSIGNDGWNFPCDWTNGVVIWDNRNRTPIMPMIDLYARELADILRTKQINRLHQKIPFIISGPEEKKMDMINLFKQIVGGEPAVISTNGIQNIDISVTPTKVPYIADALEEDFRQTWNLIYSLLGIENVQEKKERQIYGELNTQRYPDKIMEYSYIDCRRKAAKQLNERFGLNIEVVKAQDNISDNFNLNANIKEQFEIGVNKDNKNSNEVSKNE